MEFAKRDLEAAKKLKETAYLSNISLFHSQQAVEKILKALMEESDISVPKIHSVTELYKKVHHLVELDTSILDTLDNIYIETRYPVDMGLLPSGLPTQQDAEEIYNMAEKVFNHCQNVIS
jgi:HEPN domain-containing protein